MELLCQISQRPWYLDCFRKKLHHRPLTGFQVQIWLEALWMWGVGGLQVHRICCRRLVYKKVPEVRSDYIKSYCWWCWLLQLNSGVPGEHLTSQLLWVATWLLVTCLACLPSGRTLLFWSDLFVVGRVVSWKRWESSGLWRWERWENSEVAR